jgi:hypothetical protein
MTEAEILELIADMEVPDDFMLNIFRGTRAAQ